MSSCWRLYVLSGVSPRVGISAPSGCTCCGCKYRASCPAPTLTECLASILPWNQACPQFAGGNPGPPFFKNPPAHLLSPHVRFFFIFYFAYLFATLFWIKPILFQRSTCGEFFSPWLWLPRITIQLMKYSSCQAETGINTPHPPLYIYREFHFCIDDEQASGRVLGSDSFSRQRANTLGIVRFLANFGLLVRILFALSRRSDGFCNRVMPIE